MVGTGEVEGDDEMPTETNEATFSQSRHDMYWRLYAGTDGTLRWIGYDDEFWWEKVATLPQFYRQKGSVTGRIFDLNPNTGVVSISPPSDV